MKNFHAFAICKLIVYAFISFMINISVIFFLLEIVEGLFSCYKPHPKSIFGNWEPPRDSSPFRWLSKLINNVE